MAKWLFIKENVFSPFSAHFVIHSHYIHKFLKTKVIVSTSYRRDDDGAWECEETGIFLSTEDGDVDVEKCYEERREWAHAEAIEFLMRM